MTELHVLFYSSNSRKNDKNKQIPANLMSFIINGIKIVNSTSFLKNLT